MKWIPILFGLSGAGTASDEVAVLRRNAQELLRQGQAAKALVLLQRARDLDSLQVDIDHMMNQCRAKLGGWVAPGSGGDWNDGEDVAQLAVQRRPDSMYQVGLRLAKEENLPAALRILQILSRSAKPKPEYLKAYKELRARQDGLVSSHRDLAERALLRGAVAEVLEERRNAFAIDPDDPNLRLEVEKAEQSVQVSQQAFRTSLRNSIASRDVAGAMAVLAKARAALPGDTLFKRTEDSLQTSMKDFVAGRLRDIDKMMDAGRPQDAADAMATLVLSYPSDPGLVQAQEALRERIARKKRKDFTDSLARLFEKSIVSGDMPRALSLLDEMKSKDVANVEIARMATRIDSVRSRERNSSLFNEAFGSARKALARGDTGSAREWTQKALTIQPDNVLAKGLMAGLSAQQKALAQRKIAKPEPATTSDQASKVNGLVMAGISAYRGGDYKSAMERWKEALAIDPKCVQAERYLANVGRKQARLQ